MSDDNSGMFDKERYDAAKQFAEKKVRIVDKETLKRRSQTAGLIYQFGVQGASKILEIPPRKINYWIDDCNLIQPRFGASGKGTHRYLDVKNLVELALLWSMHSCGVSTAKMAEALTNLFNSGYFNRLPLKDRSQEICFLVISDNNEIELLTEPIPAEKQLNGHMALVSVNLRTIENRVREAIDSYDPNFVPSQDEQEE